MGDLKAYRVELSATAQETYERIYRKAAQHAAGSNHPDAKLLRIVDDCLDNLIPHDPFGRDRALVGNLSSIFRVKKGRLRICYAGSSVARRIQVLYISETPRKAGDRNDPYEVFSKMLSSGKFDRILEDLGIKRPS